MRHIVATLLLAASQACFSQVEPNPDLAKIYAEDQADRQAPPGSIDWSVVGPRDEARRSAVNRILKAGAVRAAADYHAAAMIFQHGPTEQDIQMAYALASVGTILDPNNKALKWLTAASWDRYLMRKGKPQWYGTQYTMNQETKRFELYQVDESAATDEDRARLNVPSLAKAKEREAEINRK